MDQSVAKNKNIYLESKDLLACKNKNIIAFLIILTWLR